LKITKSNTSRTVLEVNGSPMQAVGLLEDDERNKNPGVDRGFVTLVVMLYLFI